MATIKEVAKKARVSVGTVSNVLSGSVPVSHGLKTRVLAAIQALDYHPDHVARSLKTKATKTLGMVISDITNPFFPQMVRGAEDAAWKRGFLLITFNTDDRIERERQVLTVLRARRADGLLIVHAGDSADVSHIQASLNAGIEVVCVDRIPTGIDVDTVSVNNTDGARDAVAHLIEVGHRRIGILIGPPALDISRQRLRGYELALEASGIPVDPRLILRGDFREESGRQLTLEMLSKPGRPSALFAGNAMMAVGALRAIAEVGLECPDDIALATFDEIPFSNVLRPQVTGVAQPVYQMGYQAAELLIDKLEHPEKHPRPVHIVLEAELRIRESSSHPAELSARA